jgi:hypothetical protein
MIFTEKDCSLNCDEQVMKSTFLVSLYCGDVLTFAQASLHFILNKD